MATPIRGQRGLCTIQAGCIDSRPVWWIAAKQVALSAVHYYNSARFSVHCYCQ